ncbi:fasciclin domain-containing protein [Janibacter cremeus]|uniref:Putative surface protein with fasciclin (FAS1) repeats n=1 Tax=Janibacter cremeus TaxID=1285192 RepID=A0A852VUD2_9MICO|nr:fasciclin domain-containing protein [Janibacter cremeus]NYF99010.1 putative surface protein with fasciclin (FAS1) repeats [Janibacter cremeus]
MNPRTTTRLAATFAAVALPFALTACGSDGDSGTNASDSTSSSESMTSESSEGMEGDDAMTASAPFGDGCAAVPEDGKGSFDGMAEDPVATAAGNNPALSTLVGAVKKAELASTLDSAEDITVFAPTNDAFDAMDPATLDKAMNDPKGLLSTVLTHHVVEGRLAPEDLAGTHSTLAGDEVTVEGSDEDFTVGDAQVVCGNVQTANATVYIIDGVLMPTAK